MQYIDNIEYFKLFHNFVTFYSLFPLHISKLLYNDSHIQIILKLFNFLTYLIGTYYENNHAATILTLASASASAWWSNGPFSNNGTGNGAGNGDFDTDMSFSMNASSKASAKGNGTSTANGHNGYGPYNGYNNNWGPMDGLMDGNGDASFGFSMKARGNAKASGESRNTNQYGYAPYGYPVAVPVQEEAAPAADKKS